MCEKSRIYPSGATKRKNKAEITKTVSKLPKVTHFFAAKVYICNTGETYVCV